MPEIHKYYCTNCGADVKKEDTKCRKCKTVLTSDGALKVKKIIISESEHNELDKRDHYFKIRWIEGFKINIVGIGLLIFYWILVMMLFLLTQIIPNSTIIFFVIGILLFILLAFPISAFLFKKLHLMDRRTVTFLDHWKFGWECNFIMGVISLFAFLVIIISGLIYFFLNLILPYIISTIIFLAILVVLIPFIDGYYFNKWMILGKMHQGSTKFNGFFGNYWKPMLLFIGVGIFLSLYGISKEPTKISIPYLFGIVSAAIIFSLIGFFVYNLIERRINQIK